MYGSRQKREERLVRLVAMVSQSSEGITQAALARSLGVSRSAVHKDLVALHTRGVLLAEDERGRLCVPDKAG